ncbi:hypothetical protein EG329_007555 [Mollisiaceae sp. DMI_Dod_QoI]|nr:hypothetical protein EG329_007555 [Helotiales sp. DMI_Dod_QoI]
MILVVAKPTAAHPGSLVLRFQNIPGKSRRTNSDLDCAWILVPPYSNEAPSSPTENTLSSSSHSGEELQQSLNEYSREEIVEYVRLSHKGIVEKRFTNGQSIPVLALPFWFTYSLLGSTSRGGKTNYDGRPYGWKIRLKVLYFSRECYLPLTKSNALEVHEEWTRLFLRLVNPILSEAIPNQWTENSPKHRNPVLARRFELLIGDEHRFRAASFRRQRTHALESLRQATYKGEELGQSIHIPAEILEVTQEIWCIIAIQALKISFWPLSAERMPSSQEICIAATTNGTLASDVSSILLSFYKWFEDGSQPAMLRECPTAETKVAFLCAIIILESIAESCPYLAALGDVEHCVSKWNPVYLC